MIDYSLKTKMSGGSLYQSHSFLEKLVPFYILSWESKQHISVLLQYWGTDIFMDYILIVIFMRRRHCIIIYFIP